jgi:predicted RNA-binding Zn-ribbon protein involved in translation (DUF1610 family)
MTTDKAQNVLEKEMVEKLGFLYDCYKDLVEKINPLQIELNELKSEIADLLFLTGGEIKIKELGKFKLISNSIEHEWDLQKLDNLLRYFWLVGKTLEAQQLAECKYTKPVLIARKLIIIPKRGPIPVKPFTLVQKVASADKDKKKKRVKPPKPVSPKTCSNCGKVFMVRAEKGTLTQHTSYNEGKRKVTTTYLCNSCAMTNNQNLAS